MKNNEKIKSFRTLTTLPAFSLAPLVSDRQSLLLMLMLVMQGRETDIRFLI
jgi:hypothetical protein